MKITYGNFKYYTGGDLTGGGKGTPDLESVLANHIGKVNIMKSNHHGSATANNAFFISKLKPKHIVVTVGNGGVNRRYHLPDSATIMRLASLPHLDKIFQTARGEGRAPASSITKVQNADGDVVIMANTERYWVNGEEF